MTIHRGAVCGEICTHGSGVAVAGAIPSPTISVLGHHVHGATSEPLRRQEFDGWSRAPLRCYLETFRRKERLRAIPLGQWLT